MSGLLGLSIVLGLWGCVKCVVCGVGVKCVVCRVVVKCVLVWSVSSVWFMGLCIVRGL